MFVVGINRTTYVQSISFRARSSEPADWEDIKESDVPATLKEFGPKAVKFDYLVLGDGEAHLFQTKEAAEFVVGVLYPEGSTTQGIAQVTEV